MCSISSPHGIAQPSLFGVHRLGVDRSTLPREEAHGAAC